MPCDVTTWWNSTFNMLNFTGAKYHPAIDTMTATWDFNLHKYELVPSDWGIARELQDVLEVYLFHSLDDHTCLLLRQIFNETTLFFSQGTPNLTMVIPEMDHIDKVLTTSSDSPRQFSLTIHTALAIGKKAMNWYYKKTNYSNVYQIAISKSVFIPCYYC